jgi:hypothetical protein
VLAVRFPETRSRHLSSTGCYRFGFSMSAKSPMRSSTQD